MTPQIAARLYEIKRVEDAARVKASLVAAPHRAPVAATPDELLSLCCGAGLLPAGDIAPPIPPPDRTKTGDDTTAPSESKRDKTAERSSVSVFSQPKPRFPLLPMVRGTRESFSRERVWVGSTRPALGGASASSVPELPALHIARYSKLLEQPTETAMSAGKKKVNDDDLFGLFD